MKNLKKVLALVLACVMVFGTVTMAAGSGYPDVADDAAYAEAVKTLSALNIFKGDENGNFNPDATITRAEMAKVLCTMLNTGDLATTATSFADVPASHWASGYIAYAQQLGCIDGYGNGNFGPEDPVTYVQVVKLVMATLGYTSMANEFGGYPTGYLYVAANYEVTKGAVAGNDEPAARSLVAVLVNNAMNTPLMERVTYGTDARWEVLDGGIGSGNIQREFKTLLTKQKIYKVEGSITDTYLQDTSMKDGFVDVTITKDLKIAVEDKLNAAALGTTPQTWAIANVDASLAGADATDYVDYVSSIYFKEAANGDIVIIRVAPKSTKNVTVVIDDLANLYDATKDAGVRANDKPSVEGATISVTYTPAASSTPASASAAFSSPAPTGYVLSFWGDRDTDSRITTVEVAPNATIRYNDDSSMALSSAVLAAAEDLCLDTGSSITADETLVLSDYLVGSRRGSMTLVDQNADGKYDIIDVTTYEIAIVESVNTNTNRINFKPERTAPRGYVALNNVANQNFKTFSITLDGEAIDVADLEEYDVLNITTNDWSDPVYYDITVTRDVVEGSVAQLNSTKGYVVIDGEKYEAIGGGMAALPKLGDAGKFYLDANGDIALFVKSSSVSGNYAYLYSTGVGSFGETYVRMFTKDGAEVSYELAEKVEINGVKAAAGTYTNREVLEMYGSTATPAATALTVADMFAYAGATPTPSGVPATSDPLTAANIIKAVINGYAFSGTIAGQALAVSTNSTIDRFVTYKIDNDSKITAIDFAIAGATADEFGFTGNAVAAEWKESLGRFAGTQDITSDATLFFIDNTPGKTIEDYSVKTVADLVDGTKYDIYFFSMTDNGSSAGIVLNSTADVDTASALNIFAGYTKGKIGFDDVYYVTYWKNGALAEETMVAQGDESAILSMNIGDAFICKYDKDGRADQIATIFTPGLTQPSPSPAGAAFDAILPAPSALPADFKIFNHTYNATNGNDDGLGGDAAEARYNAANNELFFGYVGKIASSANGVRVTLLGEAGSFQNYANPLEYAVINIPETAKVTVYNAALSDSFKLAEGTISDISASYFTKLSSGDMDLSDTSTYTDYSYALVRAYKDVVTEVIFVRYSR